MFWRPRLTPPYCFRCQSTIELRGRITLKHQESFVPRILLCFFLAALGDNNNAVTEYNFDFTDSQFDQDYLRLMASEDVNAWDFIYREPVGLRMALPADRDVQMVAFANRFPVRGDFEITAKYTILHSDSPAQGYGTGPGIYIKTLSSGESVAVLARLIRPAEGNVYSAYFATLRRDGSRWHQPTFEETNSTRGSLRLTRIGKNLQYYVAEGDSRDFRLVRAIRLGSNDVAIVRVGVDKGGSESAIEVIWEELEVRMHPTNRREIVLVVGLLPLGRSSHLVTPSTAPKEK